MHGAHCISENIEGMMQKSQGKTLQGGRLKEKFI